MQAWKIMTVIALVAAAPMAWGSSPDGCEAATPEQTAASPVNPDVYLLVDIEDTSTLGFWKETNGYAGLQTSDCHTSEGGLVYEADERTDGIFLS